MAKDVSKMSPLELQKAISEILRLSEVATISEVKKEYAKRCQTAINNFYEGYDPLFYGAENGRGDLKKAYNFIMKEDRIDVRLDGSRLPNKYERGMTPDKIVYLTLIEGYHGGADKGDYYTFKDGSQAYCPHPNPGVPYWRTPERGKYRWWGSPAKKEENTAYEEIATSILGVDPKAIFNKYVEKFTKQKGLYKAFK